MEINYFLAFFLILTIFAKKVNRRCSTGLEIGFCLRVWNIELTLVPSLQFKPKKILSQKICVTLFLKKRNVVAGQQTERVFILKQLSEVFFKKGVMRNFAEFTRKELRRNLYFILSCEFCKICINTFFAEQYRTTASDYSSTNSKSTFTWDPKWTQTGLRFHFGIKFHFCVR